MAVLFVVSPHNGLSASDVSTTDQDAMSIYSQAALAFRDWARSASLHCSCELIRALLAALILSVSRRAALCSAADYYVPRLVRPCALPCLQRCRPVGCRSVLPRRSRKGRRSWLCRGPSRWSRNTCRRNLTRFRAVVAQCSCLSIVVAVCLPTCIDQHWVPQYQVMLALHSVSAMQWWSLRST